LAGLIGIFFRLVEVVTMVAVEITAADSKKGMESIKMIRG
jgi:hypothetical protein